MLEKTKKLGEGGYVHKDMILFLDVATQYTGYAVYNKGKITPPIYALEGYGNIRANRTDNWDERCLEISSKVSSLIHTIKPGWLFMEFPTFQGGTKGTAAARSGGTLELAYLCGRIAVCWEYYIAKVGRDAGMKLPLAVRIAYYEWAGQTNKEITCKRLKDHLNISALYNSVENNWADAIMMGRWYIMERWGCAVMNSNAKEVNI